MLCPWLEPPLVMLEAEYGQWALLCGCWLPCLLGQGAWGVLTSMIAHRCPILLSRHAFITAGHCTLTAWDSWDSRRLLSSSPSWPYIAAVGCV